MPDTHLQHRKTSHTTRTYHSTPVPTTITCGGIDRSPVTPVGLEARRRDQTDDVIEQLTADEDELPSPFSETELYQAAADAGISIWEPEVKDRFTERVLDRLNYEWDSVSRAFVPVIDDQLIEDIKRAARTIVSEFDAGLPKSLRKRLDEWCELHGFDSLDAVQTTVARQAVLYVLLTTTLYEWYHRRSAVSPLPDELQRAFRDARDQTGNPVFEECVLGHVASLADDAALATVVDFRHRLLYSVQPAEDFGRIYEALIPSDCRQALGQFRTPPEIAEAMQSWAVHADGQILDPGIGGGVLSSRSHPCWKRSGDPTHVDGIDRSPLSLLMGATVLALSGQANTPRVSDFLNLEPDDLQQDIEGIVCNPPYTSGDALPKEYKDQINTDLEEATGLDISARSPLYT